MLTDHPTPAAPVASATSRTSRSRVLPLAGLTLAATLALAACSGDPEEPADDGGTGATDAAPTEESTAPSEESPSADDTESSPDNTEGSEGSDSGDEYVPASADEPAQNVPKPVMPAGNSEDTEEGAEATVEYWWEAQWYLENVGDGDLVREISAESCSICREQVEHYEHAYSNNVWYHMEQHSIHSISIIPKGDAKVAAAVTMDLSEQISYADDGSAPVVTDAEEDQLVRFDLQYLEGRWIVISIERPGGTTADEPSGGT